MDSELNDVFGRPEGHRLDFKRVEKLKDEGGLAKHLVAFANRYGGQMVFGVTDEGTLQGESINEEDALESVRRVSRVRCNPPVRFDPSFYGKQTKDGVTGDVLVVDIHPKHSSPHAVVEGGNNKRRTYYIRTADESRLISDAEELRHLFVNSADPSFDKAIETSIVHQLFTYEPIDLRPRFRGWLDYRHFFRRLTDDDREFLKDQESTENEDHGRTKELSTDSEEEEEEEEEVGSLMIREVFPLVLYHSFRHRLNDFWIRREVSNEVELEAYHQYTDELGHGDLEFRNEQSIIPELSIDIDRVFPQHGEVLSVPRGTTALAEFPASSEEPAKLSFLNGDKLSLEIGIYSKDMITVLGPPLGFPGSIPEGADPYTRRFEIGVGANFGFPDIEDPQIRLHEAFSKGILGFVRDRWDFQKYRANQPPHELFRIGEKVDSIKEQLSDFQNDSR